MKVQRQSAGSLGDTLKPRCELINPAKLASGLGLCRVNSTNYKNVQHKKKKIKNNNNKKNQQTNFKQWQ
jgi:hypothetical protein